MARSRTTHQGVGLTEKQDKFLRLIAQGASNAAACRLVAIHRWTVRGQQNLLRTSAVSAVHLAAAGGH